MKRFSPTLLAMSAVLAGQIAMAQSPVPKSDLKQPVPSVVNRSTLVGHLDSSRVMILTVALPYRDLAGMQKFVDDVSNPTSPNYRHFITPQEVAARFGPSAETVKAVEDYFTSEGLKIGFESRNGLSFQVSGTVAQVEHAFSTTFNDYKVNSPTELGRSSYFSYSTSLTVPSAIAPFVQYVSGATNFYKPKPMTTLSPAMARTLYNNTTMFGAGNQGQGRKLGMLNFDGYGLSNVPLFYSHYGLPVPAGGVGTNVHQVPVNGGNGNAQSPGGEGDLDIQALCGQAPLGDIYIYDDAGDITGDILATVTKVMSDNTVDVCSASYGFSGPSSFFDSLHAQYLSGNAEGITCMFSSGDDGANISSFPYADCEPETLSIGGTVATTDGSGNRISETTWNEGSNLSGGGGWNLASNSFNVLPSWQHGTGVPVSNNHRLVPDVSGHAGGPGGAYQVYIGGSLFALDGTSASSPVFTGQLAVAEQYLIGQGSLPADGLGHQRFGRINDLIYSLNGNASVFFDVTSGTLSNTMPDATTATAGAGWDYATGWGAMNWQGFVDAVGYPLYTLSVSTVKGGTNVTGTVKISSPAGVGGVTVNLSSDNAAAVVPASVNIPQSATQQTFNITTANSNYNNIVAHLSATFPGPVVRNQSLTVTPNNGGLFQTQTVPGSMISGQSYLVTVVYKNVGTTTWDVAHNYKLQSRNPTNNTNFGMNRLPLINAPVAPGANGTFQATVIAPPNAGNFNFQWIPIQDSTGSAFGSLSTNVSVSVTKVADAARLISQSIPVNLYAGADFNPTFTMKNVGTATWKDSTGYTLMTINPLNNTIFGGNLIHMPNPATNQIAPNGQVTFSRTFLAPITPGNYTMQLQMDHGGTKFGDQTTAFVVHVYQGPNNASFFSNSGVPTSMGPSKTFNATVTMTNLGTATWDNTYTLVPIGSNNFGITSIPAVSTATNATCGFTQTFTTPASPGTYTFQWRMQKGTTKFGQNSQSVSVIVSNDAAQFVSRTGSTGVFAGSDFYAQYTMKNVGTTTWTQASGYALLSQSPFNNTVWGTNRLLVPGAATVLPGSTVVCTNLLTAPFTPGTYAMTWQMAKGTTLFGDVTPTQVMNVYVSADDASLVTQTGVPTTIAHGATFSPTITMKNEGTATWDGTYSLASIGSNNFGVASIVATTTAQNGTKAFTAVFTAPGSPGTYTFQMRMQHNTTKFGQKATLVTITVT